VSESAKELKEVESPALRPFLKWAGGKRGMMAQINAYVPKSFTRFAEPFVGAGAMFFHLCPKVAILNDLNSELMTTYRVVRDQPEKLLTALSKHVYESDYFYKVRELNPDELSAVELAARMIYLNRVGFNGLYRVNSKGKFNVPFGKYTNPKIADPERIMACSNVLKGVILENLCFTDFPWDMFGEGDFVFMDPPYVPLTKSSDFTAYTKGGFGHDKQVALAEIYKGLAKRGVKVMLTNSGTEIVESLYSDFRIIECSMPRNINSVVAGRNDVTEYLVLSY